MQSLTNQYAGSKLLKPAFHLLSVLLLASCTNRFAEYYQGPPDARIALPDYDSTYSVPGGDAPIYTTTNINADTLKLVSQGFVPYAESAFEAPDWKVEIDHLQSVSNKTGAHLVLLKQARGEPITGVMPLSVPNNTVTYTTGNATAYGPGGYATAYGNAISRTYGTTLLMMPYVESQSDYVAVFFAKVRVPLGIYARPLTDAERQELQTNLAMRVVAVVQDSPAFLTDVLPGDYLLKINSDVISSQQTLYAAINRYVGQDITLDLIRNGQKINKKVHIEARKSSSDSSTSAN